MLKYIASTLKIKKGLSLIYTYSQEGKYEAYRSKILPQTYNVNISLISKYPMPQLVCPRSEISPSSSN
jgi:hypothetical protein